jgi:hypothetical protein
MAKAAYLAFNLSSSAWHEFRFPVEHNHTLDLNLIVNEVFTF